MHHNIVFGAVQVARLRGEVGVGSRRCRAHRLDILVLMGDLRHKETTSTRLPLRKEVMTTAPTHHDTAVVTQPGRPETDPRQLAERARQDSVDVVREKATPLVHLRRMTSTWRERLAGMPKPPIYGLTLWLLVIIPAAASIFYLAFLASDQYTASARFAVRSLQAEAAASLVNAETSQSGNLPPLVGQDGYIVVTYIRSHAIIEELLKKVDLRAVFRRPEADFWARLPRNASPEELTDYWRSMVSANVDGPSGIVTIHTRAFRPDDALMLAKLIIEASEKLANEVSARARADSVARAQAEVARSELDVHKALDELRVFREEVGFIDPLATATTTTKLMTAAMSEKIRLETELFSASRSMSENAPSLVTLRNNIRSVNEQIDKLKQSLTGKSEQGYTIATALVRFERLEIQRIFAEKVLISSQDALERAKRKAERQMIYISVFVPPSLPEESRYPQRLAFSFIIPICLLIIWGIFALLVATIDDHRI